MFIPIIIFIKMVLIQFGFPTRNSLHVDIDPS